MKRFFQSAAFLAVAGVIAKVIGAVYKVPLVGVLGAEGIGIYQLVFPVYTTLLTLSSGGIPQAVSRCTARSLADGSERESRRILWVSTASLAAVGAVGALLMAVLGGGIARVQGNGMAGMAYVALAPSVFLVAVLAAFRGWWQGHNNMFPTAVSQLLEQTVKLGLGLWLAAAMLPLGLEYGVTGAVLGITASEAAATAALGIGLLVHRARRGKPTGESRNRLPILLEVYKSALPISFGALVMPLLQLIDSVMIVNLLALRGMSTSEATSVFGAAGAPVSAVINLPTVVTAAVVTALMPKLAAALHKGEDPAPLTDRAFTSAHIVGIGGGALLCVGAEEILTVLFSGGLTPPQIGLATVILRLSAVSVPYLCYMQVVTTFLQAEGRAHVPAVNLLVGGVVKAGLTAVLLMTVGIVGSAIATVAAYAVTFALDVFAVRKRLGGLSVRPLLTTAVAATAASGGAVAARFLPISSSLALAAAEIGTFAVLFLGILMATRTLRLREILAKPADFEVRAVKKSKKY